MHDLQENISCSDNFEVASDKSVKRTIEVCEDRCTQHKECKYYSYTNDNLCTLYAQCPDNTDLEKHEDGTTYQKLSKYFTLNMK